MMRFFDTRRFFGIVTAGLCATSACTAGLDEAGTMAAGDDGQSTTVSAASALGSSTQGATATAIDIGASEQALGVQPWTPPQGPTTPPLGPWGGPSAPPTLPGSPPPGQPQTPWEPGVPPAPTTPPTTPQAPGAPQAPAIVGDGQIAGVMMAIHGAEIALSQMALVRGSQQQMRAFAYGLLQQHATMSEEKMALCSNIGITPLQSPMTQTLLGQAQQQAGLLQSASGSGFDATYIDAQVKLLGAALDLMDNQLIPGCKHPGLQQTLISERPVIAQELQQALSFAPALGLHYP